MADGDGRERAGWTSSWGFILAAIGSAIGLGNIWRFPYLAFDNGGFAFLVPYFIALFVVGLPILIVEFGLGHRMKGSAPLALRRVNGRFGWLGWWSVTFVMFGIVVYYAVVISWCVDYFFLAFGRSWGPEPAGFFDETFLGMTDPPAGDTPFTFGAVRWHILGGLAAVWAANWVITVKGIQKGIEKAVRIFMPLLVGVVAVLVVWSLTLEGAWQGVAMYIDPGRADWDKLKDAQVWIDAVGQIFFTLSIGFGIMIAYASYLPDNFNVTKSAVITALGNCGFSVFAGIAVFSAIGFAAAGYGLSARQLGHTEIVRLKEGEDGAALAARLPDDLAGALKEGMPADALDEKLAELGVEDVEDGVSGYGFAGPGLLFKTYPLILNRMPGGTIFGVLFFAALIIAGLSSSISIVEAFGSALLDHFTISRTVSTSILCAAAFLLGIPFATGCGMYLLDVVDHFINNYGLVLVGILESIIVGWYFTARRLRGHLDESADMRMPPVVDWLMRGVLTALLGLTWYGLCRFGDTGSIGTQVAMLALLANIFLLWVEEHWLDFDIKIVVPAMLIYIVNDALVGELARPYGGYAAGFVWVGPLWLGVTLAAAFVLELVSRGNTDAA